jgi:hypothetical protein
MKHHALIVHYTMDKVHNRGVAENYLISDMSGWEINRKMFTKIVIRN